MACQQQAPALTIESQKTKATKKRLTCKAANSTADAYAA